MRVDAKGLAEIRNDVIERGRRYSGENLDGATMDARYALAIAGFTDPKIKKTGETNSMVLYVCRPESSSWDANEVVSRLEAAWQERAAFSHESHSIAVQADIVTFEFVTWWDDGDYYTGRIEVLLAPKNI